MITDSKTHIKRMDIQLLIWPVESLEVFTPILKLKINNSSQLHRELRS